MVLVPLKHRYTHNQVRLLVWRGRKWKSSGRIGEIFGKHEVLRWRPRSPQIHPAYRRRRRKHPAFYDIAYIRSGKIKIHKLAGFRYSTEYRSRAERIASRKARAVAV